MSDNTDHYEGVILEEMRDNFKALAEAVAGLYPLHDKVDRIDERLQNVESDVHVIKMVMTNHSGELKDHEKRLNKLEQAV
ncbi:MAG TPA: hypothetical protein VG604_04450 [Candidatus Saccharimonadales bacterium]|nr:hypothetical protein [Candidatus Saccharimonadales bacterium]